MDAIHVKGSDRLRVTITLEEARILVYALKFFGHYDGINADEHGRQMARMMQQLACDIDAARRQGVSRVRTEVPS